jgi:hypothetical protein
MPIAIQATDLPWGVSWGSKDLEEVEDDVSLTILVFFKLVVAPPRIVVISGGTKETAAEAANMDGRS